MKKKTKKNIYKLKVTGTWLFLMLIFIAELLSYTWCRVQCVGVGYEISKESDSYRNLIALQNNLKIELAHLKSPKRIEKIAKEQLGLIVPTPKHIILIP